MKLTSCVTSICVICPTFCLRDMPESSRSTSSSKAKASGGAGGGGAWCLRLRDETLVPDAARAAGIQRRAAARRAGSIGVSCGRAGSAGFERGGKERRKDGITFVFVGPAPAPPPLRRRRRSRCMQPTPLLLSAEEG